MNEEKTITIELQKIIDLHNGLISLHPTGQDILTVAGIVTELRNIINEGVNDGN